MECLWFTTATTPRLRGLVNPCPNNGKTLRIALICETLFQSSQHLEQSTSLLKNHQNSKIAHWRTTVAHMMDLVHVVDLTTDDKVDPMVVDLTGDDEVDPLVVDLTGDAQNNHGDQGDEGANYGHSGNDESDYDDESDYGGEGDSNDTQTCSWSIAVSSDGTSRRPSE